MGKDPGIVCLSTFPPTLQQLITVISHPYPSWRYNPSPFLVVDDKPATLEIHVLPSE
jgi:hypothetical protein